MVTTIASTATARCLRFSITLLLFLREEGLDVADDLRVGLHVEDVFEKRGYAPLPGYLRPVAERGRANRQIAPVPIQSDPVHPLPGDAGFQIDFIVVRVGERNHIRVGQRPLP